MNLYERHLYTIDEVAEILRVGKTRVFEELKNGRLKHLKNGRRTFIPRQAIDDYIELLNHEAESSGTGC